MSDSPVESEFRPVVNASTCWPSALRMASNVGSLSWTRVMVYDPADNVVPRTVKSNGTFARTLSWATAVIAVPTSRLAANNIRMIFMSSPLVTAVGTARAFHVLPRLRRTRRHTVESWFQQCLQVWTGQEPLRFARCDERVES